MPHDRSRTFHRLSSLRSSGLATVVCTTMLALLLLGSIEGARAAHLGVYFDAAGTENSARVEAFQTFQWFVVATDLRGELLGYEFHLVLDPDITVTSWQPNPPEALNVGLAPADWIVGTGSCLPATGGVHLVSCSGMLLRDRRNLSIRLEPTEPSSVAPERPAYLLCGGDAPLGFESVTAAVINVAEDSWGSMKTRFAGQ